MPFSFVTPTALFLLAAVPLAWWLASRSRSGLDRWRSGIATFFRTLILLALAGAIAETQWVRSSDELVVIACLDVSRSIPPERAKEAREFLTEAAKRMTDHDKASLIVFGGEASMETAPTRQFEIGQIASVVPRDHTDISSALRLAMAAFPEGVQRRILLISDGNASRGDAVAEARAAKAAGIRIDVYPIPLNARRDTICEAVVCPNEVKKNESFDAKVIVRSDEETEATVTLFRNGQLVGREPVHLTKGKNALLFPQKVVDQGMYEYQAVIETDKDTIPENNRASGFSYVQGKPRVLVLAGTDADAQFLVPALKQEIEAAAEGGASVEYRSLANIPQSLAEFQNFDGLVLVNVNAGSFSPAQLMMLESNVHDLGIGLVMVGGDDSFGAGGYLGTPVERALPVTMDLKQRQVMPNGALGVVLHTCELSDGRGNYWAKKITQAAIERLSSQDYAGVLDYGNQGEEWAIPMQLVGTKSGLLQAIGGLGPGDMPSFHTILDMAEKGMRTVNAALKHIIIITDGDPSPPTGNVMANLRAGKVTLSTVLIDAHGGRAGPCFQAMKKLAEEGGGTAYFCDDPNHLPQIFVKEAALVRKGLIFEEQFKPKMVASTELLRGIAPGTMPPLKGYVATTAKPAPAEVSIISHHEDPILAQWQYGLGKSVAFTSDAKNRWAADWVSWDAYAKFWGQVVRWTIRTAPPGQYRVTTTVQGSTGKVVLDAIDPEGRFVNFLTLKGVAVGPKLEGEDLSFQQVAPGRYEAQFDASKVGSYLVNLSYQGPEGSGYHASGVSIPYSPEYKDQTTNMGQLEQIAEITRGKVFAMNRLPQEQSSLFRHDQKAFQRSQPLWPWLLAFAACLFPLDIAVRRVIIEKKDMKAAWEKVRERLPVFRKPAMMEKVDARLSALLSRKKAVREEMEGRRVFQPTPEELEKAPPPPPIAGAPAVPSAPAAPPTAGPAAPPPPAAKNDVDYTARLLEAKRRARKDKEGQS